MAKRFYTIFIVPDAAGKFRRLVVPRFLPATGIILISLLVLGFAYLMHDYLELKTEYRNISKLTGERLAHQSKVSELKKQVYELQEKLARLSEFGRKLRNIAAPEKVEEMDKGAVGGPDNKKPQGSADVLEKEKQSLLDSLDRELTILSTRVSYQEENFKELIDLFSKRVDVILATPSIWPVHGWVSSGFGYRHSPFTGRRQFHEGIDIATSFGSTVRASAAGVVSFAARKKGYGRLVVIDHGNGFITKYAHNSKILVKKRQKVKRGDVIAKVGDSGLTTGPHLHYEVELNGKMVNPLKYIINEVADARR